MWIRSGVGPGHQQPPSKGPHCAGSCSSGLSLIRLLPDNLLLHAQKKTAYSVSQSVPLPAQVFDFAVSRPGVQFDVFMGAGGFGANNGCAGNPLAAYDYSPSSFFYTTASDGNKGQVGYADYPTNCARLGTVRGWSYFFA